MTPPQTPPPASCSCPAHLPATPGHAHLAPLAHAALPDPGPHSEQPPQPSAVLRKLPERPRGPDSHAPSPPAHGMRSLRLPLSPSGRVRTHKEAALRLNL